MSCDNGGGIDIPDGLPVLPAQPVPTRHPKEKELSHSMSEEGGRFARVILVENGESVLRSGDGRN